MRVVGLMSGTSGDGVDAVLACFNGSPQRPRWSLIEHASVPYPTALQERILEVGQGVPHSAAALLELGETITDHQAAAAKACDPGIAGFGSRGLMVGDGLPQLQQGGSGVRHSLSHLQNSFLKSSGIWHARVLDQRPSRALW